MAANPFCKVWCWLTRKSHTRKQAVEMTDSKCNPAVKLEHLLEKLLSAGPREGHSSYIEIIKRIEANALQLELIFQEHTTPLNEEYDQLKAKRDAHKYNSEGYLAAQTAVKLVQEEVRGMDEVRSASTKLMEVISCILEFDRRFPAGAQMSPRDFDQLLDYRKRDREQAVLALADFLRKMKRVMARYEYTLRQS